MSDPIATSADLRGVLCPFNFVKTKAALATIGNGEILQLILDEGDAMLNVPRSLKDEGHTVLKVTASADESSFTLLVRKG